MTIQESAKTSAGPFSRVCVIGLGYIGLPTAAMFASRRISVTGVDVDRSVVERVNKGQIHIVEPDLDIVVQAVVSQGHLRASLTPEPAEAFLVAVPTPFKGDNYEPDLSFIKAAADAIAPVLSQGNLVVLESTSPVGATEQLAGWLAAARPDLTFPQAHGEDSDIRVAHCPERVLPGKVMQELISNDRLIGGLTPKCSELAAQLYKLFVTGDCVLTNARTAEMSKLTENSFRDVNIAFANELSLICDSLQINVWEVIALANRHPRVRILRPGPGVGGHCIAVDPWFIVASSPENSRLIRAARHVNSSKPSWVLGKIDEAVATFLRQYPKLDEEDVTIACYGIAFKPDIDDMRESPALQIAHKLSRTHAGPLLVVEPNCTEVPSGLGEAELVTMQEAFQRADIHVYLVAHREFQASPRPPRYVIDTVGL
ncbi:UDP-N-acetyl-D-mannosaminuronate dehydrogenase [Oceanicola granulosus HTCC2516]|uniref:UDP-N-acetyl-D-mannosaminuronate dehydrogenase n=2 Tax=Oceanicola granulosus TaxID=252302 RepID=Q2CAF7_OCEGH|nr:UDP-N-acetyl-D-mannosamine dehydrogenase [Oceanicola granulosus]EAR49642.1 UDP-N-acetyl-D-mannosaminuronate dehydrogenase [Oceanicola granulosus HTCC2516]